MSSEQLTLFAEDSPASRTVLPGSDEARRMTATSGRNIAALLNLRGPVGLLVKTCLASHIPCSTRSYLTWKIYTTKSLRLIFRLSHSTRGISGDDCSLWPTTKASPSGPDFARLNRPGSGGDDLATAVARSALGTTPTAQDAKNNGGPSQYQRDTLPLNAVAGGPLNPEWVEWLMGFPIGWTDSKH